MTILGKRIILLRHGKSDWEPAPLADHDRPLKKRGRQAAGLAGRALAPLIDRHTHVLCSSAVRARQTWLEVESAWPRKVRRRVEARCLPELYHASAETLIAVISQLPTECDQVLLVGHNPGLEELVQQLMQIDYRFTTAAFVSFAMHGTDWPSWDQVEPLRVEWLWQPRCKPR
jgi:phosphohistidine phosphatase